MDKTCNRCGKKGLGWDQQFYKRTGKWKLENHKRVDGKWCNKPTSDTMMLKKHEVMLCELCSESNFGLIKINENPNAYEEHLQKFHPNGEKMTNLDYTHGHLSQYTIDKYWKSDSHYHKYESQKD